MRLGSCDESWLSTQFCKLVEALEFIRTGIENRPIHHHDIKPRNILVFGSTGKHPVLKICDWGCASTFLHDHHDKMTLPTAGPPYNPPEARSDKKTSHPHDVWSLRCVFFEMLIWHTEGCEVLISFGKGREANNDKGWYAAGEDSNELCRTVISKMNDYESRSNGQFLAKCVKIIKGGMLVFEPERRWSAKKVFDEMSKIRMQGDEVMLDGSLFKVGMG